MTAVLDPVDRQLRRTPLRVKLLAAVLSLVAAAMVMVSGATAFLLRDYLESQVDSELRASVGGIEAALNEFRRVCAGRVSDCEVTSTFPTDFLVARTQLGDERVERVAYDRTRFEPADLPPLPADATGFAELQGEPFTVAAHNGGMRWRMLYTRLSSGQMAAVGHHLTETDLTVKRLLLTDLLVGGTMLLLLGAVGAAIVRTSLRPLVEIERTAAAIAGGDLSRRVPEPEPGEPEPTSELGRLARALNAMLAQIESAFTARAHSEWAARTAEAAARDAALAAQASEVRSRRSEERMRQFVADASHELRTPLTTIRGFAELYRHGAARTPQETARLVRRIEDEAARMGLLVEDLLLLARLDRQRPLDLTPVELRVLAVEAVQAARAVAPDRQIDLEVAPDAGPLTVLGDDARLRQVLGNLMTNALTHTPATASVTLRLGEDAGAAMVEVVDTGPGLSPEQAERVFERFYRVDTARTRREGGPTGTGLGLAIVAALVAAHRGTVEVTTTPGGGATFQVRLPLAPATSDTFS